MSRALLVDTTRCIGCGACSAACKEANHLPLPVEARTTAYTWTVVERHDSVNVRRLCMHCLEPACASACPVGALKRRADGAVVYNPDLCFGCRYCMTACPFGVPKYQWDRPAPIVGKCLLCADRIAAGRPTACSSVCPTGATTFGERTDLLAEAHERIRREPGRYVDAVYGEHEAGGTGVLYLASVPFDRLGLNPALPSEPLPLFTWRILSRIPDFVVLAGALLYGIHWITERRIEVARAEPVTPWRDRLARWAGRLRRSEGGTHGS